MALGLEGAVAGERRQMEVVRATPLPQPNLLTF